MSNLLPSGVVTDETHRHEGATSHDRPADLDRDGYRVLASAVNHPDSTHPYRALFNHRILSSLDEAGAELDVVSPKPFAPPIGPYSEYASIPRTEEWGGYTVHHPRFLYGLPKRLLYGLSGRSFRKRTTAYVERTFDVPDVVHACHIYPDGYGLLPYAQEHDIPLFVVAHGAILNEYDDAAPGVRAMIRETLEGATGVLCVSDALAERAATFVDPAKVHTVPIGADPSQFPVERRAELRRERAIPEDETVALFVGQFNERKGIPELVSVLPTLDLPDTTFAFVGHSGPLVDDVRAALDASRFPTEHVYTGLPSAELSEWFAIADLLVLPSKAEGRPTVIYEAMASETAVLATDVGGVAEQVVDGETGRLVSPGDTEALRAALTDLTGDPETLAAMGRRGYERLLEQNWTWEGHAERVQKLHLAAIR
jgi:hypothetical protein